MEHEVVRMSRRIILNRYRCFSWEKRDTMEDKRKAFRDYIDRTVEIRLLSTPSLDEIRDANGYSDRLTQNFIRIGQLAVSNRQFLDEVVFPFVQSDERLTEEDIEEMVEFGNEMIDAGEVEYLDLPIVFQLSERILREKKNQEDLPGLIRQLDTHMDTCYALQMMAVRITSDPEIARRFSNEGLKIGEYFLSLLDKERFVQIKDERAREIVLTDARYMTVFFQKMTDDPQMNSYNLKILERMCTIWEDDFYIRMVPDFDWKYFKYRVLEYISILSDYCNERGFDADELQIIYRRTVQAWELWHTDAEYFSRCSTENQLKLRLLRNQYLVGKMGDDEYRNQLISLYKERDPKAYLHGDIEANILTPVEYIALLDPERMTAQEKYTLKVLYQNLMTYIFRMPNSRTLVELMESSVYLIEHFIEIPSLISFEEMILQCLAALHPPTYVHSIMVGQITECLCEHLLWHRPSMMVGILDTKDTADVLAHRAQIIDFCYRAALYHDTGKIAIMDTIFVYGRKLLDMEFEMIRNHPRMGYQMLLRHESTARYAEVALGHHKWHDNSRGYPEEFDITASPLRVLIDIVQCADCLDAATDSIGRSYNKGKSLDQFLQELKDGSGTRYAPWLQELFAMEDVRRDIDFMLTEGRRHNYQKAYHILRTMQEREINL